MFDGNFKYIISGLSYFKKSWKRLILVFLISIVLMTISLVPIELTKRLIDIAIPSKNLAMVLQMLILLLFLHLLLLTLQYIQDLMMTKLSLNVTKSIQLNLFNNVSTPKYWSKYNPGQLLERIVDDSEEIVESTMDLILTPILELFSIIIALIYMFTISTKLTLVSLIFVPVFILITLPVNKIIRKKYTKFKELSADVYNNIEEKLNRIKMPISRKKKELEIKDLDKHIQKYNSFKYDYEKFSDKLNGVIAIISDFAPYTILLYSTYLIIGGSFEIGTLFAFSMLTPRLFGPVQSLAGKELELQTLGVTAKRVFSIIKKPKKESS